MNSTFEDLRDSLRAFRDQNFDCIESRGVHIAILNRFIKFNETRIDYDDPDFQFLVKHHFKRVGLRWP